MGTMSMSEMDRMHRISADESRDEMRTMIREQRATIAQLESDQGLLVAFVRADVQLADIEVRTHTDFEYKAAFSELRASRVAIEHLVGEGVDHA